METAKYHLWKLLLTETTGTTETTEATETTERVASTYQQFTVGKLKYFSKGYMYYQSKNLKRELYWWTLIQCK